jgi:hypothetical protein
MNIFLFIVALFCLTICLSDKYLTDYQKTSKEDYTMYLLFGVISVILYHIL